jgi:hypothetical protein
MFASAKASTRADLRDAFDAFAEAHGVELATLALERSTGAREVSAVPDRRIINGMVELVGGYSFVGSGFPGRGEALVRSLAKIHEGLAAIGDKAFASRKPTQGT